MSEDLPTDSAREGWRDEEDEEGEMRREKEKRDGEEKEFFRSFRSRFARTIAQHEHGNRAALVGALPVAHLISVVYKRQRERALRIAGPIYTVTLQGMKKKQRDEYTVMHHATTECSLT